MNGRTSEACFLGIDAGTTSLKAALFNAGGRLLAVARDEYQLLTSGPNMVELDAEVYWRACCRAVRQVVTQSGVDRERIAALCIASQAETLIPVDAAGCPVRNAIVWLDNRAVDEARLIGNVFDSDTVYRVTGQPEVTPAWPACKILWMRRREPDAFARAARYLLVEDFLLSRLTGQYVTDSSVQASSLLLDIGKRRWWQPMLDVIGICADKLGRLAEPGELLGSVCPEGAEAAGLSTATVAVSGGIDQAVGAVGAGNIAPGIVTEMTGGALAIVATLDRIRLDPERRVPCHVHARPGYYCLLPWGQTAGMALRWFRDRFYRQEARAAVEAGRDAYDEMTAEAAEVPAGSEGLLALPHLEGAACPEFNPAATAVFFGVGLRHTRAHFTRSILEAVAYMLRRNLELVERLGVPVKEVRSIGGGARSPLWLHIKADVLQKPVKALECEEVACLGAALTAAVATGHFIDLNEGVSRMVRLRCTFEPDSAKADVYGCGYARYLELYERLAPMFTRNT